MQPWDMDRLFLDELLAYDKALQAKRAAHAEAGRRR